MKTIELNPGDQVVIKVNPIEDFDPYVYMDVNGSSVKVLSHCRRLSKNWTWRPLNQFDTKESSYATPIAIQDLDDYYLQRINKKEVAIMWPRNGSSDLWAIEEFEPDENVIRFLKDNNAWEPL